MRSLEHGLPEDIRGESESACIGLALGKDDGKQVLVLEVYAAFVTIVACGEELENHEILFQAR